MFKKTYALMFALFCASTPSASCVGTARAGLLKSSLRDAHVSRCTPVESYINAEDTQVLAQPVMADTPGPVGFPPLQLPPEPADAEVVPIPPPPCFREYWVWPPERLFGLLDLAWRPRKLEPSDVPRACPLGGAKLEAACERVAAGYDEIPDNSYGDSKATEDFAASVSPPQVSAVRKRRMKAALTSTKRAVATSPRQQAHKAALRRYKAALKPTRKLTTMQRFGAMTTYLALDLLWELVVPPLALVADVLLCIIRVVTAPFRLARSALRAVGLVAVLLYYVGIWVRSALPVAMRRLLSTGSTAPVLTQPVPEKTAAAAAAPPANTAQVFVKTQTKGKAAQTVTVDNAVLSGTVLAFKEQLAAKTGVSCSDMRLVFEGKPLADDQPLTEYGVRKHSTVHGVLRGRGGMPSAGAGPSSATPTMEQPLNLENGHEVPDRAAMRQNDAELEAHLAYPADAGSDTSDELPPEDQGCQAGFRLGFRPPVAIIFARELDQLRQKKVLLEEVLQENEAGKEREAAMKLLLEEVLREKETGKEREEAMMLLLEEVLQEKETGKEREEAMEFRLATLAWENAELRNSVDGPAPPPPNSGIAHGTRLNAELAPVLEAMATAVECCPPPPEPCILVTLGQLCEGMASPTASQEGSFDNGWVTDVWASSTRDALSFTEDNAAERPPDCYFDLERPFGFKEWSCTASEDLEQELERE